MGCQPEPSGVPARAVGLALGCVWGQVVAERRDEAARGGLGLEGPFDLEMATWARDAHGHPQSGAGPSAEACALGHARGGTGLRRTVAEALVRLTQAFQKNAFPKTRTRLLFSRPSVGCNSVCDCVCDRDCV